MGQPYSFGFMDSLLAQVAAVPQSALHLDIDAICRAYDAIAPVARRLGIDPPRPRLAGFAYSHVSTLGAKVTFSVDAPEPHVAPCLRNPRDIDLLREPDDYLSRGVVPLRLQTMDELRRRRPDAELFIGHQYQGPVTTAMLLMGPDFLMLPYDDPARAHRLLDFVVRSSLHYCGLIRERLGQRTGPREVGMCDDFAGLFSPEIFGEFVAPCWNRMYTDQHATARQLHCELLREGHLPFLKQLHINEYDPSVDQYLPPEVLARSCPVPYTLRIWPSEVQAHSAEELVAMYRHRASFHPVYISFHLERLADEQKIVALLNVARELAA